MGAIHRPENGLPHRLAELLFFGALEFILAFVIVGALSAALKTRRMPLAA
ncbi:hypothetical protein ACFYZJ_35355 [Streptomyces sp. NPDC001848]